MLHLKRRSLKAHLIAVAIVSVIPTLGVGATAAWLEISHHQALYNDRLGAAARSIALLLRQDFEHHVATLQMLAASPLLDAATDTDVAAFRARAPHLADALRPAIAFTGAELAPGGEAGRADEAGFAAIKAARASFATGLPAIGDLARGGPSRQPGIAVTVPVIRQGHAIAVIATTMDPDRLSRLITGAVLSEHAIATIVDGAGTIVARSSEHARHSGQAAAAWFVAARTRAAEGVTSGRSLDGADGRLAFAGIPGTPRWTVAVFEPDAVFHTQWMSPLVFLFVGNLLVLCLALGSTIWLVQRVLNPVALLREQAEGVAASVAEGDPRPALLPAPAFHIAEFEKLRLAIGFSGTALAAGEKRNRALVEASAAALWRASADGQILESRGWELLTGQKPDQLRGRGWLDALHPDDVAATVEAWDRAIAARTVVTAEYRVRTADGGWLWHRARGVPILNDAGTITEWYGVVVNIHDQKVAESALQSSEARMRALVDTAPDAIVVMDVRGIVREFNKSAERIFGYGAQDVIGRNISLLMPRHHAERHDAHLARYAATGERSVIGAIAPVEGVRKDGQPLPLEASISEWHDATGARFFTGVLRDITDRRAAELRQAMLSREVDHRAKNVLTIVQSVIRLTQADSLQDFRSAIEARIFALARVHSLLAEGGWADAELRTIAARELAAQVDPARHDAVVSLSGPSYRLNATAAQPVAMVLHELAINAVKHGALSTREGRVRLDWQRHRDTRTLCLRWQEEGGPRAVAPRRRGFGLRLIETSVARQLGGAVAWSWPDTGLVCEIALPDEKVRGDKDEAAG